jgi:hypothetical protein
LGTGAGIRGTGLDVEELDARRGAEPKEVGLSTQFDNGECNGAPVRWEDVAGVLAAEGGLTEGLATCAPNLVLAVETEDLAVGQKAVLLLWRVASESSLQAGSRGFDSVDTPSAYSRRRRN